MHPSPRVLASFMHSMHSAHSMRFMRLMPMVLSLTAAAALSACIPGRSNPADAEPPPVYTRGDTVAMFAPGVISTGDVFASSFTPDGRTVYFTKAASDRSTMQIMQSRWSNGAWSAPTRAPFSTGTRQMDPHVAMNGKLLYFTAPRRRDAASTDPDGDWDTWVVRLREGDQSAAERLTSLANSSENETYPSVTIDSTIFFGVRQRFPGAGSTVTAPGTIAYIYKKVRTTPVPVRLADISNASDPYITTDGRVLIVSATGRDGRGRANLFVTIRGGDGRWSAPRDLGREVNSDEVEFSPSLSPDRQYLFFSRLRYDGERPLGNDIYVVPVASLPVLREALQAAR
jgi:Tol biopolymer transport system component